LCSRGSTPATSTNTRILCGQWRDSLCCSSSRAAGMKTQLDWERSRGSLRSARKPLKKRVRQYPRTKVSLPVTVFPRRQLLRRKTVDLSLTGAFILLPELSDLTCPVELFIEIPNMYVVPVVAAIVRFHFRPVGDGFCQYYG
jgi:PilZ domain